MHTRLVTGLLLVGLSGCAHAFDEEPREGPSEAARNAAAAAAAAESEGGDTVMVGDQRLWRERWEDDLNTIRGKAAFELNCPGSSLNFQVLEMMTGLGHDDWAKSIGVTGCGSRAVYTRHIDRRSMTWLIESKTIGEPPARPAQPVRVQPPPVEQPTTL